MKKPKNLPKKLTITTIPNLPKAETRYDIRHHDMASLWLTVYPSGKKSWVFRYRFGNRNKRFRIGDGDNITPTDAKQRAKTLAGDVGKGIDPNAKKQAERREAQRAKASTLRAFLEDRYEPWALVERKSGAATVATIKQFEFLLDKQIESFTNWELEKWRKERHKSGISPSTTNRQIAALRACLSKALEWGVIDKHPLLTLKPSKVDKSQPIRSISESEENQLRAALRERDERIRQKRASGNAWREQRSHESQPEFGYFVDHLQPLILLALNTGMRRGELFNLRWSDVAKDHLTVRGKIAKSSQTRTIPLNPEARKILDDWSSDSELVFPGPTGEPMTTIKTAWGAVKQAAELPTLRFHDLRHTFGTRILQRGGDIKTVSALLGHADIATTTKYLHATDDSKRRAVELL